MLCPCCASPNLIPPIFNYSLILHKSPNLMITNISGYMVCMITLYTADMNAASVHQTTKSTPQHMLSGRQSLTELLPYCIAIAVLFVLVLALGLTVIVLAVALRRARKTVALAKGQSIIQLPPPPGKQCTQYSQCRFLYYLICTRIKSLYSGTSDSGLSQIRTQYDKPLYKGQDIRYQNTSSLQFSYISNHRKKTTSLLRTTI